MKWIKKEKSTDIVKKLIKDYQLKPLVASILERRGFTEKEDLLYFIEKNERYLHSPFLFVEMEEAVDRIMIAVEGGEKIKIFGDRDVDGITATVILYSAIKELGGDVSWSVPLGDEDYGLTKAKVQEFADSEGSLILTVDCGISDISEIDFAGSLGIDVIVTDHHNPPQEIPNAIALLNPKLDDSGYPYEHLAGCAVAFKLALALALSKAPFYGKRYTVLNIEKIDGGYKFDAILVKNLVIEEEISEVVVPGVFNIENSRLKRFLVGGYLLVFGKEMHLRYLRECFGDRAQIALEDLETKLFSAFPKLQGKSLLQLKEMSTLGRYSDEEVTEIKALFNLWTTCELRNFPAYSKTIDQYIELVTIGSLADLMPLVNENRLMVSLGLEKINNKEKQGEAFRMPSIFTPFMYLVQEQKMLDKPISVMDLVYQITPVINATGRLGVPDKAVQFFLETDSPDLASRAREILAINEERKKIVSKLWDKYLSVAKKSYDELKGRFVILAGKDLHRGVTGLLASRLSEYFQAPAMVVSFQESRATGSVRSYGGLNVKNMLEEFRSSFNDFGGHDFAAGFSIQLEAWAGFHSAFVNRIKSFEIQTEETSVIIDAELPHEYVTPEVASEVLKLEPFGEGFPPLKFVVQKVKIDIIQIIGKNGDHLRMTLAIGEHKWVALFWNTASRVGIDFKEGDFIDILFHFKQNYFKGQSSMQMVLEDIKQASDAGPYSEEAKF